MTRQTLFVLTILSLVVPLACTSTPRAENSIASSPPRPARINHLAFFKLKNPFDADELVHDCNTMLGTIPGVVSHFAGRHLDTGRTNIDSNYDVGFYVGFMTEDAYAAYVQHPNHLAAVNKWKPRWEWIRIQDVIDDTP